MAKCSHVTVSPAGLFIERLKIPLSTDIERSTSGMRFEWVVVAIFAIVAPIFCIQPAMKCWECDSYNDPKCNDPFDNTTATMADCSKYHHPHLPGKKATMCRKIRQKVNGQWRYVRGCAFLGEPGIDGDERYCLVRSGTWDIHIEYCTCDSKEGCNGANVLHTGSWMAFVTTFVLGIAWQIHKHFL